MTKSNYSVITVLTPKSKVEELVMVMAQQRPPPQSYQEAEQELERFESSITLEELIKEAKGNFVLDIGQTNLGNHIIIIEFPNSKPDDFFFPATQDLLVTQGIVIIVNRVPQTIRQAKPLFDEKTQKVGIALYISQPPVRKDHIQKLNIRIKLPGVTTMLTKEIHVSRFEDETSQTLFKNCNYS